MRSTLLTALATLAIPLLLTPARATPEADQVRADIKKAFGFVPGFIQAVPDRALPGFWGQLATLQVSEATALPCKTKELIGLAVAAQIPCAHCTYAHTEFARLSGATADELGEAVAVSALTRHWSTVMNGLLLDEGAYRDWVKGVIAHLTAPPTAQTATPRPSDPYAAAMAEIKAAFGVVPEFASRFPKASLPAAWRALSEVELAENTAIGGKEKSLISIAVASQIPCRYCVYADTEFAKLQGATEQEIQEAIAMAALTREWSTLLNGQRVDLTAYMRDIDRLVRAAKAAQLEHGKKQAQR